MRALVFPDLRFWQLVGKNCKMSYGQRVDFSFLKRMPQTASKSSENCVKNNNFFKPSIALGVWKLQFSTDFDVVCGILFRKLKSTLWLSCFLRFWPSSCQNCKSGKNNALISLRPQLGARPEFRLTTFLFTFFYPFIFHPHQKYLR